MEILSLPYGNRMKMYSVYHIFPLDAACSCEFHHTIIFYVLMVVSFSRV